MKTIWTRSLSRPAALAILFFLMGCAGLGDFGQLRRATQREMTIEGLQQDWRDYNISYIGYSVTDPSAVLFDPKGDETTLVGERWAAVSNPGTLSDLIAWARINNEFPPYLYRLVDSEGGFAGYIFTGAESVAVKQAAQGTLRVYGIPYRLKRAY